MDHQLKVVVNSELTLDAGWWEEIELDGKVRRMVHPPKQTMFVQILDYLNSKSLPNRIGYVTPKYQGLIATNICLRWGSYFAVLADRNKPLAPQVQRPDYRFISHISDGEMARINIEASAALARWIDLRRQDENHFYTLASRAFELLPITTRKLTGYPEKPFFWAVTEARDKLKLDEVQLEYPNLINEVNAYPTRVFANALLNYSWRNGSGVEDIHAGRSGHYSLLQRRIRPSDERNLFRTTAHLMKEGFLVLEQLLDTIVDWSHKVMPYHFVGAMLITPTDWTLIDESFKFSLPGSE